MIERDETSAAPNREREEVDIGQLARAMDPGAVEASLVEKAQVVRPELVVAAGTRLREALHDCTHG